MKENNKTVIGVSLTAGDPECVNEDAPTFPPTSCDYVLYPWLDPCANDAQAADRVDENALCLALMTDNATSPSPPGLPYSGTFVNATDNHAGTFCMHTNQFWKQWFLEVTQVLNAITEIYPTTPYAQAYSDGSVVVAPRFIVGHNPDHPDSTDRYFSFRDGLYAKEVDRVYWDWSGDLLSSNAEDSSAVGSWVNHVEVNEYADTKSAYVSFSEGGQEIKIQGTSHFTFTVEQTGLESGADDTDASFTITTDWHVNFALGVVSDGGLQITRIADDDGTKACTSTGVSNTTGIDWNIDWSTYTEYISDCINESFENSLGDILNNLQDALENQHKLFLPASGTFLMRDAEFNHRGDLLSTLFFNGATPPGDSVKVPEYLGTLPDRKDRHPENARKKPSKPFRGPTCHLKPLRGLTTKRREVREATAQGLPPM